MDSPRFVVRSCGMTRVICTEPPRLFPAAHASGFRDERSSQLRAPTRQLRDSARARTPARELYLLTLVPTLNLDAVLWELGAGSSLTPRWKLGAGSSLNAQIIAHQPR